MWIVVITKCRIILKTFIVESKEIIGLCDAMLNHKTGQGYQSVVGQTLRTVLTTENAFFLQISEVAFNSSLNYRQTAGHFSA